MKNSDYLRNLFKEIKNTYGCEPEIVNVVLALSYNKSITIDNVLKICLMWWDGPVVEYYANLNGIVWRTIDETVMFLSDEETIEKYLLGEISVATMIANSQVFELYKYRTDIDQEFWIEDKNLHDKIKNEYEISEDILDWINVELLNKIKSFALHNGIRKEYKCLD